MDQFQISENQQLEYLLFIDKVYNEYFVMVTLLLFYLTRPVNIELKIKVVVIKDFMAQRTLAKDL